MMFFMLAFIIAFISFICFSKKENFKTWGNYRTYRNKKHNNNCSSQTASKSLNSKNIINNSNIKKNKNKKINIDNITNDKDKIDILLNMLNATNINEGIMKLNILLKNEKDMNQLKELFKKDVNEKLKLDKNMWLSNVVKSFKRSEKYKHFCKNIMILYNIKNFEEFKSFINANLSKKKSNKEYSNGKNKICIDDKYYVNKNINVTNKNDNLNINKMKKNVEKNDKDYYSNNSEDINFSNSQNYKVITDYMQTYY